MNAQPTARPCNARFLASERRIHPAHTYDHQGAPVQCSGWSAEEDAAMNARARKAAPSNPLGVPHHLFYPYR
jgi:hypothetical protein